MPFDPMLSGESTVMYKINREALRGRVEFIFSPDYEDDAPRDHFDDQQVVNWVCDQIERGNLAAWFCAKVVARLSIGTYYFDSEPQYLGCCSYETMAQFLEDPYYKQLQDDALESLAQTMEKSIEHIEVVKLEFC
jgi:hypothetical protein